MIGLSEYQFVCFTVWKVDSLFAQAVLRGFNNSELCLCTIQEKWCRIYVCNLYVYARTVQFYFLLFICMQPCIYLFIYVTILNYITNSPICFGASAPTSGNFGTVFVKATKCRSQWPRGLRRRSAAARLLRLWVRIPPGACVSVVSVVCC